MYIRDDRFTNRSAHREQMWKLVPEKWLTDDESGRVTASLKWARSAPLEASLYGLTLFTALTGAAAVPEMVYGVRRLLDGSPPGWDLGVLVFLTLFVATAFLYGARRWSLLLEREAQRRTYNNSQDRLEAITEQLLTEVRTMPPAAFLDVVGQAFRQVDQVSYALLKSKPEAETVRGTIRLALQQLAWLAWFFDGRPEYEIYRANIMTYHSAEELPDLAARALQNRLEFVATGVSVTNGEGVLDLRKGLSAVSELKTEENQIPNPDPSLRSLALAIPKRLRDGDIFQVLPGPPFAWWCRTADGHTNTDSLIRWYKEHGANDRTVRSAIEKYFGDPKVEIGSFISFALVYDEFSDIDDSTRDDDFGELEPPIGVVNISRRTEGILKDEEESGKYFLKVTRPIRITCTRLLHLLAETEMDEHGTRLNLTKGWKHQRGWSEGW